MAHGILYHRGDGIDAVFKVTKRLSMPRKEYVSRVLPIGAFYAASLWLSNSAYLHPLGFVYSNLKR